MRESIDAARLNTIGVAFDGDGVRALFVDETGTVLSGDHVLYAIGSDMHRRDELAGDTIVATVMSNSESKRLKFFDSRTAARRSLRFRTHARTRPYVGRRAPRDVIDFRYNTDWRGAAHRRGVGWPSSRP